MSKMGQELEKRLDEAKYAMYEAIQSALVEIEEGNPHHAHLLLSEALAKVGGGI